MAIASDSTIDQLMRDAEAYEPPDVLPAGDDAAAAVLYKLTNTWALHLAYGAIAIDTAYALCKSAAMALQVHTQGRRSWKATKPFLEWMVETTAARFEAHLEVVYGQATRALKTAATAAIGQGHGERGVKAAIAAAAESYDVDLPFEILHEAYSAAVAQARSNARWMSQREHPQA